MRWTCRRVYKVLGWSTRQGRPHCFSCVGFISRGLPSLGRPQKSPWESAQAPQACTWPKDMTLWRFLDFYPRCQEPSFNLWSWMSAEMTTCPMSARARKSPPSSSSRSSPELKLRRRLRPTHSCLSSPQTWGSLHLLVFTLPAVPQVAWAVTWTQSPRLSFSILWTITYNHLFPPPPTPSPHLEPLWANTSTQQPSS